jgi:hypothetical protein
VAFLIEKLTQRIFGSWGNFRGSMAKKFRVLKRTAFFILINFLGTTVPKNAHAVADFGNAAVLPVGRYQTTFRFGNVSDIQDKFSSGGILQSPSRMNQRFDNAFLMKDPEFQKLAKIIDEQLLPHQKPSKDIDMGSLEFAGDAQVSYFVPQIARGMTSNWSIGLAVPIIKYQSDIHTMNGGVNTARGVLSGVTTKPDIGGLQMVSNGPSALFAHKLITNGYREISNRDESFMGDIAIGSSLKLYDTRYLDFFLLNQLTLPTGPKDNPDDLLDLPIFGKTEFQTVLYTNLDVTNWLELGMGVSYTWGITDDIQKRVPANADDKIPPASSKESLEKDPGDAYGIQVASMFKLSSYWQAGTGYEMRIKGKDKYSGSRGSRYDLLEKDTDEEAHIGKFKITYTTIEGFLQGDEKIPYSLTYAFADHFAGRNVERQLTHEVLLKLYF